MAVVRWRYTAGGGRERFCLDELRGSNPAPATMKALHTRKIQMQVTVVARPRNHEGPAITAIRLDGGFFVP